MKDIRNWIDWYAAFGPATWSQWALAALAGIAAVVGFRSLRATREALTFTLRPQLMVRNVKLGTELDADSTLPDALEIYLEVVNRGGASARINSGNVTILIDHRNNPNFMRKIVADDGAQNALVGQTLKPGVEFPFRKTNSLVPDDIGTILEFGQGLLTVYVLGYFWYQDQHGNHYKTGFCRRYDRGLRRFGTVRHPDYEYAD